MSAQNKAEIDEFKEKNKWLARTIGSALIVGFIGIVVLYVKIGMGID
jgi:hypothetical protein